MAIYVFNVASVDKLLVWMLHAYLSWLPHIPTNWIPVSTSFKKLIISLEILGLGIHFELFELMTSTYPNQLSSSQPFRKLIISLEIDIRVTATLWVIIWADQHKTSRLIEFQSTIQKVNHQSCNIRVRATL